jgi:hypothetical protein
MWQEIFEQDFPHFLHPPGLTVAASATPPTADWAFQNDFATQLSDSSVSGSEKIPQYSSVSEPRASSV